ncbi:MAG: pyruvate dehydrogenase (acetyl-transferring) E1 component subunit alpha [Arthrobacter sp.]|uniref:pyruvate dehydrogenase (acetyl-transferring) E1 component subunit alpha n=1 Tax=unclassified Arthrobacter TaxID=235627 RepID=UPI0026549896|nr:pyruvate dehydrogenase (acetyl-transferring) E1 component subunit alpha [Micrococcaceae bacterium]MDN5824307.1 pyruvate dehydrogenase (acetyl-transferring) E1 component subunit alpha [Micrococcaceae bacterium]MDN5878470.1 pyruvate dehydrogenase (acetyl-transferring) E1 component subunit alpha [Micrococcaceae bacterium]MDN5887237.1 pyruvate dehydrogenase (acetyl-transferring) E1 component subunit alpha [Micrococcaceae bacterium]MDN5905251.1 pyruvate dehydrogenase (acetyl-transferring) E1 comp
MTNPQAAGERGEELIQLIDPSGRRTPHGEFDPWVDDIEVEALRRLHTDMVAIRRVDQEGTALQRQGELALWPPLLGQEAAQIGAGRALEDDDFIFPSYRETGLAYCRGISAEDTLRVWRGNAYSGWDPFGKNMATPQIIIGAQALHAVGYAMGIKYDGGSQAAITFFGDGATSQGDVNEAMVFAASYQAPVVFFCQNNHWAISEPVGVQSLTNIADRSPGFGIPSLRVDGNDVLACLAATRIALDRARSGNGPTFIEAVTYRMGPHTTADDPTRYRDANELDLWAAKDPIERLERHLVDLGVDEAELKAAAGEVADSVAASLRQGIIGLQDPEPMEVFENVYSQPHAALDRQREHYALYREQFADASSATEEGAR